MSQTKNEELKKRLAKLVVTSAMPYLEGWIKTLGEVGSPNAQVPPRTRASAAKQGLEFVTKFMDGDIGTAGADLLRQLQEIDDRTDADGTTLGTGAADSELREEAVDLGESPESDGGDQGRV